SRASSTRYARERRAGTQGPRPSPWPWVPGLVPLALKKRSRHLPGTRTLSAAAEAGISPGRALERQVVVLRRVGDAEAEVHDVEDRHCRQRDAGEAVVVADLEDGGIAAGGEGLRQLGLFEQAVAGDAAVGDQVELAGVEDAVQRDPHA